MKEWTEGRLRSFITSTIRSGFRRYPPKFEVLKEAFTGKKTNTSSGRIASHYRCAKCQEEFPSKQVQVDHIDPVVDPKVGFISWDEFIKRLFCGSNNLQVLCLQCHLEKSKQEKEKRIKNAL